MFVKQEIVAIVPSHGKWHRFHATQFHIGPSLAVECLILIILPNWRAFEDLIVERRTTDGSVVVVVVNFE